MQKLSELLPVAIILAGVFLIVGTTGAVDNFAINTVQMIAQYVLGGTLVILGVALHK